MMALLDLGCNTTLIDESSALTSRQICRSRNSRSKCAESVYFPAHQEMPCRTSRKRGSPVLLARCDNNSLPEWSGSEFEVVNNQTRVSAPEELGLT